MPPSVSIKEAEGPALDVYNALNDENHSIHNSHIETSQFPAFFSRT
jgi:hypothetical protein